MLWLFGEIWLWLLIAFVIGIALSAFTLVSARRTRTSGAAADDDLVTTDRHAPVPYSPRTPGPAGPPVTEAERTRRIHRVADDAEESPDQGHRRGVLPLSSAEWHARNEWPDERDMTAAEESRENRPRRGE